MVVSRQHRITLVVVSQTRTMRTMCTMRLLPSSDKMQLLARSGLLQRSARTCFAMHSGVIAAVACCGGVRRLKMRAHGRESIRQGEIIRQ